MASLKDIKYSVKRVETDRIFFAREGTTLVKKELNSFAICSAECNNFLLIISALGNALFFCFILPVISFIVCHDLMVFRSFWTKYIMFELKKYRTVMFHDTEEWCRIWRKNDLWFGKWHEEFDQFLPEHLKVP